MLTIDGSIGGGSVVRLATGLAAATRQDVQIENIRAERPQPGLKPQHVAGVDAVAALTDAAVDGNTVGSDTLTFRPNRIQTGERIRIDIPTAGSVGLALQPLQIAMLGSGEQVNVTVDGGATVGKWAPPVPYLQHVALPVFDRYGHEQEVAVNLHGFYPKGGALTKAVIGPSTIQPLDLVERSEVQRIGGVSIASTHLQDAEVADRQRTAARRKVANQYPSVDRDIAVQYVDVASPGSCIVLWAVCDDANGNETVVGGDALGEQGKRAEVVGNEAADTLLDQLDAGAPVDVWLADQLVPLLVLAGGKLRIPELTDHVETNIAVVEQFVDRSIKYDADRGIIRAE